MAIPIIYQPQTDNTSAQISRVNRIGGGKYEVTVDRLGQNSTRGILRVKAWKGNRWVDVSGDHPLVIYPEINQCTITLALDDVGIHERMRFEYIDGDGENKRILAQIEKTFKPATTSLVEN